MNEAPEPKRSQEGIHDPKHPVWGIIRLAVVGGIMIASMQFLYNDPIMWKDWFTIAAALLGSAGIDVLKAKQ